MNMTLLHGSFEPLIYGVIIIVGLMILIIKWQCRMWSSFFIDIAIFIIVFKMHGGTMTGGMAAAIAALIGGLTIPPLLWFIRKVR